MPEDPAVIGPFRLLGRLGTGGMGRVFLARSEGGRTVAVKVVHAELAAQREFRLRFTREVAALERVGGDGTAPLIDSDTAADAPWVAVSYVPGPSLRTVVDDHGPLPADSVHTLAAGLGQALDRIHAAGLVHRDLKPSNILLAVDGPRIIDFGIARAVDTVTDGGLTSTGAVVGSPGFMSPEQVRGEKVTPASDIFCVGAVLAYAVTGRQPFGSSESGVHAVLFRIAHDEPDLEGLPDELGPLVRACLDKDPARRPTAAELARTAPGRGDAWLPPALLARLGAHAAQLLDADTPVPGEATAPGDGPLPKVRRRRGWRTVLAVVSAVAVLAGGGVAARALWPDQDPESYEKPRGSDSDKPTEGPGGGDKGEDKNKGGDVPDVFIGAWEGVLEGTDEHPRSTGRIEISQGEKGRKTAVYVQVTGERLCMGRSVLVSADDDGIVFGESDVTTGVPAEQCLPAAHQTLSVRSPDVMQWTSGAVSATFRRAKTGPQVVPAELVGRWKQHFDEISGGDQGETFNNTVTITQGPVGAPLVRFENSYPRTDPDTGQPVDGTVNCASTAVLGGAGGPLIIGPQTPDSGSWDPECSPLPAQYLRADRFQGKERLLIHGMSADGEPGEYYRE
ncbi:serine/threonine-protein kinase [Streptomyces sp. NPDC002133]|uniref:serine/threonine-protein kinase n=1 Tax=Streptomyces sp. NPDC002133 TaxID=3154409 RepID=UPI00332939B6